MKLTKLIPEAITLPELRGVPAESEEIRNQLAMASVQILTCTTAQDAEALAEAAQNIRTFCKDTRDLGMELRRPVNALAARIKFIEDDFLKPLEDEQARLERIKTDFDRQERKRVEEETRQRAQQIERLEAHRKDAEVLLAAAQAKLNTPRQLDKAIKAEAAVAEATAAVQSVIRAPLPSVNRVAGMPSKRTPEFEVLDIHALYAANRQLVTLELNKAAVRAIVEPRHPKNSDEWDESIPGLRSRWTDQTSTRVNK